MEPLFVEEEGLSWGPPTSNNNDVTYYTGTPPPSPPTTTTNVLLLWAKEEESLQYNYPTYFLDDDDDLTQNGNLWSEESVNLELFNFIDSELNSDELSDEESLSYRESIDPRLILSVATHSPHPITEESNDLRSSSPGLEEFIELSTEFQAILDSLPSSISSTEVELLRSPSIEYALEETRSDRGQSGGGGGGSGDVTIHIGGDVTTGGLLGGDLSGEVGAEQGGRSSRVRGGVKETLKRKSGSPSRRVQKSKPRLSSRTDKIARKKEQNKTAASRYREKKKLLQRIISSEEEELLAVNKVLTNKREGVQREVSLLKQLLRELFNDRKLKFK